MSIVDMPICRHGSSIKSGCEVCDRLPTLEITSINNRLNEIYKSNAKVDKVLEHILDRIEHLETVVGEVELQSYDKKPHKCPACDGFGVKLQCDHELLYACRACEGKGIVWG